MKNLQILIGNLGQDPETVTFDNGGKLVKFSVATSLKWKDKQTGEQKQDTQWHNIIANGGLADVCEKYLKKGSKVYIEGYTKHRSYQADGITRYITEVKLQELKMLSSANEQSANNGQSASVSDNQPDDDLPF